MRGFEIMRLPLVGLACALAAGAQKSTLSPEPPGPENPELRMEAVKLLERAAQTGTPARWLTHDQILHFRVMNPGAGEAGEGEIRNYFGMNYLYRTEVTYGDYRLVDVRANGKRGWLATPVMPPPIIDRIRKITPLYMVKFDHEDIIRSIHDEAIDGRAARCIEFVTAFGEQREQNQICADKTSGVMLLFREGNVALHNSDFFECSGGLFPGRIVRTVDGLEEFEITQKMSLVKEFPQGTFEYPPDAKMQSECGQFRRAFEVDTPRPPVGPGPGVVEVTLRGYIGTDGRVFQLSPFESSRPDLNEQAIQLVSKWTFDPARCDGHPVTWFGEFRVEFKGY